MGAVDNYIAKRKALVESARNVPCMDCGGTFPSVCMDFDHREPSEKLFPLAAYRSKGYDAIRAELAKCDVVCANCHRIRTHGDKDTQLALFSEDLTGSQG